MTSLDEDQLEPEEPQVTEPALRRSARTRGAKQLVQNGYTQQMEDLIMLLTYEDLKKTLLMQEIIKETPTVPEQLIEDPSGDIRRDPTRRDSTNLGNPARVLAAHERFTTSLASLEKTLFTHQEPNRASEESVHFDPNHLGDPPGELMATHGSNTLDPATHGNSFTTFGESYHHLFTYLPLLEDPTTSYTTLTIFPTTE